MIKLIGPGFLVMLVLTAATAVHGEADATWNTIGSTFVPEGTTTVSAGIRVRIRNNDGNDFLHSRPFTFTAPDLSPSSWTLSVIEGSTSSNLQRLLTLPADDGTYRASFTGNAVIHDGGFPSDDVFNLTSSITIRVFNVAPSFTQTPVNTTLLPLDPFSFTAAATDPGILDILTFDWDLNGDGQFDDFVGNTVTDADWTFSGPATHSLGVRVSDDDGGSSTHAFAVEIVPEPASMVLLGLGGLALIKRRRVV